MGAREKYIKGLITHCKVFILKKNWRAIGGFLTELHHDLTYNLKDSLCHVENRNRETSQVATLIILEVNYDDLNQGERWKL